jgi:hypothetical protein
VRGTAQATVQVALLYQCRSWVPCCLLLRCGAGSPQQAHGTLSGRDRARGSLLGLSGHVCTSSGSSRVQVHIACCYRQSSVLTFVSTRVCCYWGLLEQQSATCRVKVLEVLPGSTVALVAAGTAPWQHAWCVRYCVCSTALQQVAAMHHTLLWNMGCGSSGGCLGAAVACDCDL